MVIFFQFILVTLFFGLSDGEKTPCCVSKRFHGQVKSVTARLSTGSSTLTIIENRYELNYDNDMQMDRETGTVHTDEGGKKSSYAYTTINDYTRLKSYYIFNNTGSCSVDTASREHRIRHCIPSTLQLVDSYMIGSEHEAVLVDSWEGVHNNYTYSMQTLSYDCTPVSATIYGVSPKGDTISETVLYGNYTQYQLSSSDVFNIPAVCKTADPVVGK